MTKQDYLPIPLFDTLSETLSLHKTIYEANQPKKFIKAHLDKFFLHAVSALPAFAVSDYEIALKFLYSYRGSEQTFNAYRRDIERLIQWSWFIKADSILHVKREDIEALIEFCIKPPKKWIGFKNVARYKMENGKKIPNPEWRPFDINISKRAFKEGETPEKAEYQLSQKALKALFAILSSFYKFCLQDELISNNPVLLIRQKSKFLRKENTAPMIRRLSDPQWKTVIQLAKEKAIQDKKHERTVFILSCLYGMYLRISELIQTPRWSPSMSDFFKDHDGNWWFKTVGKGNKARQIAVSDNMLASLMDYRISYLSLPPYPELNENIPLICHEGNIHKSMTDARTIRRLVQSCFDEAADYLANEHPEEAQSLRQATVHWLRHTGISEDVKIRPREHVRDDAGHSSGAITDKYIDVALSERAKSAKNKRIA